MSVVGVDVHGDPQIKLTSIGRIIEKYIEDCNKKISKIYIDEYIIMPNHIHFIISINGSPWTSTPTIPKIISSLKTIITKKIGYSIWQRNYYEHIIRNEKEYLKIKEYIINNPLEWENDEYFY